MMRVRVFILAVLCTCLAAGDGFAVKMVEDRNPTQAAAPETRTKPEITVPATPAEKPDLKRLLGNKPEKRNSQETPTTRKSAQYVTMDFDGVDITMLIKFIADLTKKNFIVDSGVTGKVTVISPRKMTIGEAYRVFESVLEVNGYTTVPMNGVIKIMKSADAMTKGVETRTGAAAARIDKLVTQIIPLRFSDAEEMKNLLTPLIGKGAGQILSYPQSNILIVTDTQSNIKKILDIIKVVDIKGFAQDVRILPLTHASAADLAAKLTQIITGTAQGGSPGMTRRMAAGGGTAGKEPPKIIAYERTNSLIVMGTPQDMKDLEALVQQLDIPTPSGKEDIHVYYLQHANAEEVAKVLGAVPPPVSPEATPTAGVPTPNRPTTATGAQPQNFKIAPDKATNSLIIFADPYTYNNVVETIKYLDIPRKQVFVKAFIMEVNTSKDFTLGVEWSAFEDFKYDSKKRTGAVFGRTGSSFITDMGGLPTGPLLGVVGEAITINKGGTEITFPNMASFINAMAKDSDVNIISTPQIITMDNKEAEIKVGKNVPYLTKQDTDATNINRTIRTYDYRDVGVNLKITPQINQQGNVRMDLFQEITQLVPGTGEDVYAPTTLKRTATTAVMVKDGATMVIGGLIGETLTLGESRVPLLGKIPLLGWLFKTSTRSREKTNLYIFLTPTIIDTDDKVNALFQEKYGYINRVKEAFDKGKSDAVMKATETAKPAAPTPAVPETAPAAPPTKGATPAPSEDKTITGPSEPAPGAPPATPEDKEGQGDARTQP